MRVLLDANVLLAGIFTRGVCEQVLDVCWDNAPTIVVVSSDYILREFAENAAAKFRVPANEIAEAVEKLRGRLELVEPIEVALDACRDADDLPILGTAVAGNADYLVTGDRDLLALNSFRDIAIISPRAFYDMVRTNGG